MNPIGERTDRRIARKEREMKRDAIALAVEEVEKRDPIMQFAKNVKNAKNATVKGQGPLKNCTRTPAHCKPCQEAWDRYVSTLLFKK
jgi:hypothetical protein